MQSFLFSLFFLATTVVAAPRPPYSIDWKTFIAAKGLSSQEQKLVRFIVQDSLWFNNEHEYEAVSFAREMIGNRFGLDELDAIIEKAEHGDARAFDLVRVLLETSSFQRVLEGLERGSMWTGTLILRPDNARGNLSGILRHAIARSLEKSGGKHERLFQKLADAALLDPNNSGLVETVTALAAIPKFSSSPMLRDYFLLMSIHPEPKVRISGLFGLGSFAKDPFVREVLLQASRRHSEPSFAKKDWAHIQDVLAEVGAKYPSWQKILMEIYSRWQREPFPNRIRDMGDFNWERMANAAAAQALLSSVAMPTRGVTIETSVGRLSTQEILEFGHAFPAIDGLQSGNGTGFHVVRKLTDVTRHRSETIYPATITVSSRPEENWILKGMNPSGRDRAFEAMLNGPIDIHFGHLESVMSLMMYKFLRLEPPAEYYESLSKFQRGLRSKMAEHESERKRLNVRSISIDEVRELLESKPSNLVAFPRPIEEPDVTEHAVENESVFVASLESVYAARALAVLGEKGTAARTLISLLPKAWSLTPVERQALAKNLETRDDEFGSANLDDGSKSAMLSQVFEGFTESLGGAEARRVLIRWLAGVKDARLGQEAQRLLPKLCGSLLVTPKPE